jgi:PTH1 family peptidyl-tRNA hydrolase
MPHKKLRLVVGLGNPGAAYAATRHNIGFMALEAVADRYGIPLDQRKFNTVWGRGAVAGLAVILAEPQAFMNRSGPPLQQLAHYYRILCEDVLVIHDDIDLTFGRFKIKEKGGHGGHNGVRSLIQALGGGDFVRLRIGVGRSEHGDGVVDHVLGRFSAQEQSVLPDVITRARDAVETILCKGTREGMNRFNNTSVINSS